MDELRSGNPFVAGDVTLVPIERYFIQFYTADRGSWLSGLTEPFAVVVCDTIGIRAFDIKSKEI